MNKESIKKIGTGEIVKIQSLIKKGDDPKNERNTTNKLNNFNPITNLNNSKELDNSLVKKEIELLSTTIKAHKEREERLHIKLN